MLLCAVYEIGFPKQAESKAWWEDHAAVFQVVKDPEIAAEFVWDWVEHIEKAMRQSPPKRSVQSPQSDQPLIGLISRASQQIDGTYLLESRQKLGDPRKLSRLNPKVTWW